MVVIFRVKVILYRQWMVFMSLVIDLIGQLNCHVIGYKSRKLFDWYVSIRLLRVSQGFCGTREHGQFQLENREQRHTKFVFYL